MRGFCFFVILIVISFDIYAQGSATGCLVPYYNRVYTSNSLEVLGSSQLYNNSPSTPLSANYCSWTPSSTGSSCVICDGTLGVDALGIKICLLGSFRYGSQGTFTMVQCDLDSHFWIVGAMGGLFGLVFIKRRNRL